MRFVKGFIVDYRSSVLADLQLTPVVGKATEAASYCNFEFVKNPVG